MAYLKTRPLNKIVVLPLTYGFLLCSCATQDATKPDDLSDADIGDSSVSDSSFPDGNTWNPDAPDGTELTWPVVCGNEYPCSDEFRGNPPPYDQCSFPTLYWTCPNNYCLPDDPVLQDFYQAWLTVGPSLLSIADADFMNHVYLNDIRVWSLANGLQSFMIDFLVTFDWVVAVGNVVALIDPDVVPTKEDLEYALDVRPGNHYEGLPKQVISIEQVNVLADQCGHDFVVRLCNILYNKTASKRGPGFMLREGFWADDASGACWFADIDLVSGSTYCFQEVCGD